MSETKCECPTRKALEEVLPFVDGSFDGAMHRVRDARATLSAPCPCEALRDELAVAGEGAQFYNRKAVCTMVELNRTEAERDQLRAELAGAMEALKPSAQMHFEGSGADNMARRRGTVSDAACVWPRAFADAAAVLESLKKCATSAAKNESKANVLP